jgi:hypothetical protein
MNKKPFSLDELPKADVFGTPPGYFDDLPMRIQKRAVASSRQAEPRPTGVWLRRTWLSLAGASLVAALVYLSIPNRQETLGQETLGTVGQEDIVGYLNERNLTQHDLRYLINTSTDEDGAAELQELDSLSPVQQLNISDEDIRQHLTTEDLSDLI